MGTESEEWVLHRGTSVGRGRGGIGENRYREEEAWLVDIKKWGEIKMV